MATEHSVSFSSSSQVGEQIVKVLRWTGSILEVCALRALIPSVLDAKLKLLEQQRQTLQAQQTEAALKSAVYMEVAKYSPSEYWVRVQTKAAPQEWLAVAVTPHESVALAIAHNLERTRGLMWSNSIRDTTA